MNAPQFTQPQFTKHFRRDWKHLVSGQYNLIGRRSTHKQYDPHGTKMPAAYADMVREYVRLGELPESAINWKIPSNCGGSFGDTCQK
jgi:hypothetical protein